MADEMGRGSDLPCGRLQHEAQVLRTDRIPLSQRRRYARRSYQGLLQLGGLSPERDGWEGYNVLFPIGFDAYGLPTENYAIKTGKHPRQITDENIAKFTKQLKKVGFSFDWSRVIDTTEEGFYKWTQWIFLKMFEHGLVFRDKTLVNYCPSCKVVLSNEDSQGGKCDICHSDVIQKSKDVWYLRITEYADKLLEGLKDVDYPANVKAQQEKWIGKSTGAFVDFSVDGIDEKLRILHDPLRYSVRRYLHGYRSGASAD